MKKVDSVVSLVCALTKAEKKHFNLNIVKDNPEKDYLVIYDIVINGKIRNGREIKDEFYKRRPRGSFEVSIQYLYERLLDTLLVLRKKKDVCYDLYTTICRARLLYERSLYHECFEALEETIKEAKLYGHKEALLLAFRQQAEYLSRLNYPRLPGARKIYEPEQEEKALEQVKFVSQQDILYNQLKYALFSPEEKRTQDQLKELEELAAKEYRLFTMPEMEPDFEVKRKHLLFQANYMLGKGDYKSALNSFKEMCELFEANKQYQGNPPFIYLSVLEDILDVLRQEKEFKEMRWFIEKLKSLEIGSSHEFEINTRCLIFLYELLPHYYKGNTDACKELIEKYQHSLYANELWLNQVRKCELFLYTALVYFLEQDYRNARKYLSQILPDHNMDFLPFMRVIRLIYLLIYYEQGELELVHEESRLIRRGITLKKEKPFKTEQRVLWFLNKRDVPVLKKDRDVFWAKLKPECEELFRDKYEYQLLSVFDFTAWMEARLLRKPLVELVAQRAENNKRR